ncbi:MAG TPA: ectonucleotide pyrophosphatase/phosphodiesterase [Flavitalea sp.]|nr:ectonucleotide pyrophosphatase/phosphodiesterase [Flavitalea sp.]
MKKVFVFLMFLSFGVSGFSQKIEHVVLITIDGFRPDYYLDPSWHTTNLAMLLKDGVHAMGVNSVFPSITYPSHTTIVTGVWPAKHGVYYNSMFEPNGSTGKIYWHDSSVKVPTLWTAAKEKGLKTAALFWPVNAGAPTDYNIADIGSMGEGIREQFSRPAGIIPELKAKLFNDSARIEYGKDHNVAAIAAYIIKKDQPNLMTVHFFGVDHYSHQEGREGSLVSAAIADADSSVGIVIKAIKDAGIWDKTVFIVTGDHGFMNVETAINPNVWLAKEGLITDIKKDEWKAQFFSAGGSSYLYLKDKNDTKTAEQVKSILNKLPAEEKKLFRIIDRSQMNKVGGNPEVAFALSSEVGGSFGNLTTGDAIKTRKKGGAHGQYPDSKQIRTGFIAVGPGIKKGSIIQEMNLRDIAPYIAKVLGLSLPSADGKIPAALLSK